MACTQTVTPHALRSQPGSHFNQIGRQREARIKEIRILGEKITPAINQMVRTKAAGVRAGGRAMAGFPILTSSLLVSPAAKVPGYESVYMCVCMHTLVDPLPLGTYL